jgi:hypothetical protein
MARPSRSKKSDALATPKKNQSTPKRPLRARNNEKSKYFESVTEEEESEFDGEESSAESAESFSEVEDEPPQKKVKTTPKSTPKSTPKKNTTPKSASKGKASKSKNRDVSEDEDEEPWETFIPKEVTPDAGDVEYSDSSIHPNTLQFLRGITYMNGVEKLDLAENNDREWFWSHEVHPF